MAEQEEDKAIFETEKISEDAAHKRSQSAVDRHASCFFSDVFFVDWKLSMMPPYVKVFDIIPTISSTN